MHLSSWNKELYQENINSFVVIDTGFAIYNMGNNNIPTGDQLIEKRNVLADTLRWHIDLDVIFEIDNSYDNKGQLITQTYLATTPSKVYYHDQYHYTYNNNGQVIKEVALHSSTSQYVWDTLYYNDYIYNNGLLSKFVSYKGQQVTLQVYTYDNQNRIIEEYIGTASLPQLNFNAYKSFYYHYNLQGDVDTLTEFFHLNPRITKDAYWYDVQHKILLHTQSINNKYPAKLKQVYHYNGNGKILYTEESIYDDTLGKYIPQYIDSFIYSTATPQKTRIHKYFDLVFGTNVYINSKAFSYSYNNSGQVIEEQSKSWSSYNNNWEIRNRDYINQYYYSYPLSVTETKANSIQCQLYPNPAASSVTVSSTVLNEGDYNIYIYDVSGRLVSKVQGSGIINKTIPVAHLGKGQYLMKLQTEQGNTAEQFIISR